MTLCKFCGELIDIHTTHDAVYFGPTYCRNCNETKSDEGYKMTEEEDKNKTTMEEYLNARNSVRGIRKNIMDKNLLVDHLSIKFNTLITEFNILIV